jgi:hypothetical protein
VRRAFLALAALLPLACTAQPPVLWHLQVDNDVLFHKDRWYTSGIRLYRSAALDAASPAASFLRLPSTSAQRLDFGVIQDVYTSDPYAAPGDPDRPNAARLLLSVARHDISAGTLATLGIDAGVSGPSARGEEAQRLIHRIVPAPKTDWSVQVDDRADVQVVGAWSHRLAQALVPGAIVVHGGAVAGTLVAFGHLGLEWRSDGPGVAANPLLRFAATPPMPREAGGLSYFAGASLRAVGRNRLLERRDDDPAPEAARERRVSRVAAGAAWSASWGVVTLGIARDSAEFEGQSEPHRFGSLTVSIPLGGAPR